ncbi:MAG: hypothetical protein LBG19_10370 [Prevotellaceae bacterium]|jgi:hypothetical protein|nr:hypothetical protein [Prevotellaceae bacterium]
MKKTYILLFCLIININLNGQIKTQSLEVANGEILNEIVETKIQYAFEEFVDNGSVIYKNGVISKGKLNYNYLLAEMQFINPSTNEIFALANVSDVSMIVINNRRFLPLGKGGKFVELLSKGNISLAVNRDAKALSIGQTGVYGSVSPTSSITAINHLSVDNSSHSLKVKNNICITVNNYYYLYTNGKLTFIKGIKTFSKISSKSEVEVNKFVEDNKIDFKKEADLIKLTEYCNQL